MLKYKIFYIKIDAKQHMSLRYKVLTSVKIECICVAFWLQQASSDAVSDWADSCYPLHWIHGRLFAHIIFADWLTPVRLYVDVGGEPVAKPLPETVLDVGRYAMAAVYGYLR